MRPFLSDTGDATHRAQHTMNWIAYGPHALLFHFADKVGETAFERSRAIVANIEKQPPEGLVEFVPAFTSILVEFDTRIVPTPSELAPELAARFERAAARKAPSAPIKEIPVRYDGEDLESLARSKGMTVKDVAALHSAPVYKVYMLGFSPGFPYLGDLDPRLHTPRLATPRPRIRAGSVAIGGEHTGIYTVDSPGGWNIIGQTWLRIFDPARGSAQGDEGAMFFLKHGDRVKFIQEDTG